MNAQVWIAVLVGMAAVADDLARRKISNWISVAALAGGLGWQTGQYGWSGLLYGFGGAAAGFSVFLIFYLLGGMGGGDVKLMSGFGALLGAGRLMEAALWTAGVGGVLALGVLGYRAVRNQFAKPPAQDQEMTADERKKAASIPYAPAIALGVWLALVPKN
ncbi:MAG: prepilin peptidase [Acidobacteriota bacterium]